MIIEVLFPEKKIQLTIQTEESGERYCQIVFA